jgi:hypothetical protein
MGWWTGSKFRGKRYPGAHTTLQRVSGWGWFLEGSGWERPAVFVPTQSLYIYVSQPGGLSVVPTPVTALPLNLKGATQYSHRPLHMPCSCLAGGSEKWPAHRKPA